MAETVKAPAEENLPGTQRSLFLSTIVYEITK